jgi:hypothetical protein
VDVETPLSSPHMSDSGTQLASNTRQRSKYIHMQSVWNNAPENLVLSI